MVIGSCYGQDCCAENTEWSTEEGKCVSNPGSTNGEGASAVMAGNPSDGNALGVTTSGSEQVETAETHTVDKDQSEGFTKLNMPKNNILQSVFHSNKVNVKLNGGNNFVAPYDDVGVQFASV